jgi:hypothetical protein
MRGRATTGEAFFETLPEDELAAWERCGLGVAASKAMACDAAG